MEKLSLFTFSFHLYYSTIKLNIKTYYVEGTTNVDSPTLEINEELFTEEVDSTFNKVISILRAENIFPDSVQKQMLYSHLKAMVIRSHTHEPLPEVEIEMFDEISKSSHKLAEDVVNLFPTLAYEESYLLSVHFEVAKENELTEEFGA